MTEPSRKARAMSAPERNIIFEEGLLGVTLKRSIIGRAVVSEINQETQAASNGIVLGDVVRQVGDLDLRTGPLEKKAWLEFIELLKTSPRPLILIVSTGSEEEIKQKPKKAKNANKDTNTNASADAASPIKDSNDDKNEENQTNQNQDKKNESSQPIVRDVHNPLAAEATKEVSAPIANKSKTSPQEATSASPPQSSQIPKSTPTSSSSSSHMLPTMADLAKCLEWPNKGPLNKGAKSLIGGEKRSKEFVLNSGPLRLWAPRGWFGGSNLQPRQVFLCNTILLICEPTKEDEKKQLKKPKTSWQDRQWMVETAIELEACLLRDVPPSPLQGVNDDDMRGAFEIKAPVGTIVLVGESNRERAAWVNHIFDALLKANPEAVANKPGWIHQIRTGNLLAAASSCDLQQMFISLEREPPAHLVTGEFKLMAVAQDIDEPDVNGDSALHLVLKHLEVLSEFYAPTSAVSPSTAAPTSNSLSLNVEAIQKSVAEAVMMLVAAGASISLCNRAGKLPLHIASEFMSDSVVSALLSAQDGGAQVNDQDEHGYTPAHVACFAAASSSRLIRHLALLQAKYPNKQSAQKQSNSRATSSAILTSLHRTLGCLGAWGADLELVDAAGLTITQRLALGLHFDVLNIVLICGADVASITQDSGLPLDPDAAVPAPSSAPKVSPGPSPSKTTTSPVSSPSTPSSKRKSIISDDVIANFPISNLIHLICGQHLVSRHLSGGIKSTRNPSSSSPPTTDALIPTPIFALPETLRVLLFHLSNKNEANVMLKLINAQSPHCGLTPLQLLLRSRGVSSPSVASAALLLLVAGCDMFSLDPQGHSIASTVADGLQTHFQRNPLTWYHEEEEANDSDQVKYQSIESAAHVVTGTMLLVTKGRLAFIGGGDRERSVHFILVPDKRGLVHNGQCYKGPFLIGLRVKKDELRVSAIAHSSSVKKIDGHGAVIGKRGERTHDAWPIVIDHATVENEDYKSLIVLTNLTSERNLWEKYLMKAFLKSFDLKKQLQSNNEKELFGNQPQKKSSKNAAEEANATVDVMNANRNALLERGEKLNELSDKTQELSDTASEFEKMCKELEKQQKNRWF